MKVCIDLDDVLFDNNAVMTVVNKYRLPFKRSDIKSWGMYELPEFARKEIYDLFVNEEFMGNLKPIVKIEKLYKWFYKLNEKNSNSIKATGSLSIDDVIDGNLQLHIITARDKRLEKATINMIKNEDFKMYRDYAEELYLQQCFNSIFIIGRECGKGNLLSQIKPDLFIEDAPNHVMEALNLNIPTVMISNENTPYNHILRPIVKWYESINDIDIEEFVK